MLKSLFLFFVSTVVLVGCAGSEPFLGTSKTEYCEGFDCKPEPKEHDPMSNKPLYVKTTVPINWDRQEKLDLPKDWLSDRIQKRDSIKINN